MGISRRNPRGNFNWQSRILKKKAQCCGQLDEPVPPPPTACYCYTVTSVVGTCTIDYIDCSGVPQSTVTDKVVPVQICALENSVNVTCPLGSSAILTGGSCVCDGTPAPSPLPSIGAVSGLTSGVCGASNINYTLSTSGADCYNWILPNGVTATTATNLNSINVNFDSAFTSGTLTIQVFYACQIQTASIVVEGRPSVPILDNTIICPFGDGVYTVSATGATSYNWTITGDDFNLPLSPPPNSDNSYYIQWGASGGSITVTATNSCGTSDPLTITTSPSCP